MKPDLATQLFLLLLSLVLFAALAQIVTWIFEQARFAL